MRILMVGGKTGGHVFPAIAIAQAFVQQLPTADLAFAGMADSLEARTVAAHGWIFFPMQAAPLKGQGWWRRVGSLLTVLKACGAARGLLRRWRPDCVVGTGGFVSGPVLLMAAMCRIPTVVHEQNSVPGLTNRWLGRAVRRVCITYPSSQHYFPRPKVRLTGLPLRRHLVEVLRTVTPPTAPPWTILVIGGSQGAQRLNQAVLEMLPVLAQRQWPGRVIHLVGKFTELRGVESAYAHAGIPATILPFAERMEEIYPQVHLAISRAGASSLAELALAGIPSVLVPFPFAADQHQERNAEDLVQRGAALLLRESELTGPRLAGLCLELLLDPTRRAAMQTAMRGAARPEAAAAVVHECLQCVGVPHV